MSISNKLSIISNLTKTDEYNDFILDKYNSTSSIQTLAFLVASSFNNQDKKLFFLFPTLYEAEEFYIYLTDFLSTKEVYLFSCEEMFKLSSITTSTELISERLNAIYSTTIKDKSILIAHASSYLYQINNVNTYLNNVITLNKSQLDFNKNKLINKLLLLGYKEVDHIMSMGQFALRGQIIDIFDPHLDNPIRIEYFGDEIDEIRYFSLNNEISINNVDSIKIYPNTLFYLDIEERNKGLLNLKSEVDKLYITHTRNDLSYYLDIINLLEINNNYSLEKYNSLYPLFTSSYTTISSYLNDYKKYIFDINNVKKEINKLLNKQDEYFKSSITNLNSFNNEKVFSSSYNLDNYININDNSDKLIIRNCSYKSLNFSSSIDIIKKYLSDGYKINIILKEPMYSNMISLLKDNLNFSIYDENSNIRIINDVLSIGFEIPSLKEVTLTSKELFGLTNYLHNRKTRYNESKLIKRFDDLKKGDYVVHDYHGIGKYDGVVVMEGLEYLKVLYQNEAVLYVPLSQFKNIKKYSSKDGYIPTLDKLGGSTWARKKSKIRNKIDFITDQLIDIYALRSKEIGYSFHIDDELEKEFLKSFPFKYTLDQQKCINEVKLDMEKLIPMDRLITGDVGFGKTEIAFYSAYIAILNNKQVAMLCPTTILSMQHYKNALSRFNQFNIKVCVFSRLVPKKEQNKNIKLIKEGKIDLIIGTHRILSNNIEFKDLGLMIIDEEQRFGVKQKEQFKDKFKNIDSLTLSATPIPRTMQLSLLNIRQLSFLDEPPLNRLPVKTFVLQKDNEIIYEAIEKELNRKGQVYYLYNNIDKINSVKDKLTKKFPSYKIEVCHGRLSEDEIENIMNDFYIGNIDILVCTTIIESGLDIPKVNTIIVENSQNFGLAQLYQIKGRVGRSDTLAYAYFFYSSDENLQELQQKRLKALKEFTELGSGYKIAMQDLNIRGAGDILGNDQSGFVDTLGYEGYMDLINEVLKEKELYKKGIQNHKYNFELSFSLDALIPPSYCSTKDRLTIYSELNDINSLIELEKYKIKVKDVYGKYPIEMENLFQKRKIEILLNSSLFSSFKEELGQYIITSSDLLLSKQNVYKSWEEKLEKINLLLKISIQNNNFVFKLIKTKNYLEELSFLLETVVNDFNDK